ncbi:hypothetical protein D3C87_1332640 [compost metagenome]
MAIFDVYMQRNHPSPTGRISQPAPVMDGAAPCRFTLAPMSFVNVVVLRSSRSTLAVRDTFFK